MERNKSSDILTQEYNIAFLGEVINSLMPVANPPCISGGWSKEALDFLSKIDNLNALANVIDSTFILNTS